MSFSARRSLKDQAHMNAARAYADLSQARRLKVGAVIVRDDRVVSIGYNGTPSGRDNNCELEVPDDEEPGLFPEFPKMKLVSKPEVCHAEMNAIMFAAKNGVATHDCTLYITHSPCFECAKMMVQCGIKEVFYDIEYRDTSPIEFLKECNVTVKKI